MIDLSTDYLGLKLKNPLVPSASPLSRNLDTALRLEDAGAAALVMYSLFEEELRAAQRALEQRVSEGSQALSASEQARREEEAQRIYTTVQGDAPIIIAQKNGIPTEGLTAAKILSEYNNRWIIFCQDNAYS